MMMYSSMSLENQVFIVEEFIQLNRTEELVTTEIDNEIKYTYLLRQIPTQTESTNTSNTPKHLA
jgi:hypothetical protein